MRRALEATEVFALAAPSVVAVEWRRRRSPPHTPDRAQKMAQKMAQLRIPHGPLTLLVIAQALVACRPGADSGGAPPPDDPSPPLTVVSFNTGTTESMGHDAGPDDGYTEAHAATSDAWYGDGLAWRPAIDATTRFLAEVQPELVAFQEIFHADRCADIPDAHHDDFVCEGWAPGDPTVTQQVLGAGYQVACHPGKDDKCLAVRTDWGRIRGCDGELCLEGLAGAAVDGCGSGARVARAVIEDADGHKQLTVVSVHGTSGVSAEEQGCRIAQIEQVFDDLGDGAPGTSGPRNLVLGDLNTDPGRFSGFDASAAAWVERVDGSELAFISAVGPDAPGSYQGLADIDHVLSDAHAGACWHAGVDPHPSVIDAVYFDHKPVVCELTPD